ncbi:unnamed protein product [Ostreobium quekettii]|uniref:Peptidase S54 rhomboid domain-containing protein n=1 Tax=Ostreobium quekettii TaxID=121088 RepID=A0A8S1IP35_9CHLO|nr:unnamed protein product [Ostreobium quekettii]
MRALRLLTRLLAAGASSASAPLPKPSPAFDQIRVLLGRWPAPRDPSPIRNFTARSYFRSAGYHRGYWGSGNDVLYGLLGANVAVFFLWRVDPYFMKRHFTCSLGALEAGRLHTFVTSCFSHIELGHLAANMLGLYFFGRNVAAYFGPRQLLNLYMAGGVLSMMADVGLQAYNNRGMAELIYHTA